MNYTQAVNYLCNLEKFGTKLGLSRAEELLEKLGNPEKNLKVIHVTGTNGKGSVCAMLSSILQEAGCKVGLYTSPHLKKFNERYKINGKDISDKDIVRYFNKVKRFATNQSFFEFTTSMAFLYFYEKKVDFLILEVGMGGRLDATNVVKPLVSIITNVGLEHTGHLGNTIAKIAYEKSGIIKDKVPVVTAAKGDALKVIKDAAKQRKSPLFIAKPMRKVALSLKGGFQQSNAAIVLETMRVLNNYYNLKIKNNTINKGLLKAKWPGRLQFIKKNILVDCAHNLDGVKALYKELKKLKYNRLFLIIGILKDKDYKSMLRLLTPLACKTILTKVKYEGRATEPKDIAKYAQGNYMIAKDVKKALKYAKTMANKNDLILITGSIYLVGEVI